MNGTIPSVPCVVRLSMPAAWFQAIRNCAHLLMGETWSFNLVILCRSKLQVTLDLCFVPLPLACHSYAYTYYRPMRKKLFPKTLKELTRKLTEKSLKRIIVGKIHSKVVLSQLSFMDVYSLKYQNTFASRSLHLQGKLMVCNNAAEFVITALHVISFHPHKNPVRKAPPVTPFLTSLKLQNLQEIGKQSSVSVETPKQGQRTASYFP